MFYCMVTHPHVLAVQTNLLQEVKAVGGEERVQVQNSPFQEEACPPG